MQDTMQIQCPWCGESFFTFYDFGSTDSSYVEDCQVCCRPIKLNVKVDETGDLNWAVDRE